MTTWVSQTSATPDTTWKSIAYGVISSVSTFIAVSNSGSGTTKNIMTSSNGSTWTLQTTPNTSVTWSSICSNGSNVFVAIGNGGGNSTNRVMTSSDGSTWTQGTSSANIWSSICYGNSLFVAVTNDSTT